jgi:hypothetical protein
MKYVLLAALSLIATAHGFAQESFPGLKSILSEAEWKRAGLDHLTPDQIGVIDAALIRHHGKTVAQHESVLAATRSALPPPDATAAPKRGMLERFGLPMFDQTDWRDVPPLQAKVTSWLSANRFKLDNDQVWEGMEPITYELVGKPIEIHARPSGQFALTVDGKNTMLRVKRVH